MKYYTDDYSKEELKDKLSQFKNKYFALIYQTNDYRCCCRKGSYYIEVWDSLSKHKIQKYWIDNKKDNSEIESIILFDNYDKILEYFYDDFSSELEENALYWGYLDYKIKDYSYSRWYGSDFNFIYKGLELIEYDIFRSS